MSLIALKNVYSFHKSKFVNDEYQGEKIDIDALSKKHRHNVLSYIPVTLTETEKNDIVSTVSIVLTEVMLNAVGTRSSRHISMDGKEFETLFQSVVKPALEAVGVRNTIGVFDAVLWTSWVCIILLEEAGWRVKEIPERLTEAVENGESGILFSKESIENILVSVPDVNEPAPSFDKPVVQSSGDVVSNRMTVMQQLSKMLTRFCLI